MADDYGVTRKGFRRKRYEDILEDMQDRARHLFGENVNLQDRSPLGIFIRVTGWFIARTWSLAENVYNAHYISTATGQNLDKVVQYVGIRRRPPEHAYGEITIEGDPGETVPEGFRVSTADDIVFHTTKEVAIGADGTVTVRIRAEEPGLEGNVEAGQITEIVEPTTGIEEVYNEDRTRYGRDEETDRELRDRYMDSVTKPGASTADSIRAELLDTEGVRAALVIVNDTMDYINSQPPKSIEAITLGGLAGDIAEAIISTKAAGITTYGEETFTVIDDSGQERDINFSFADMVDVYVSMIIETTNDFPENGNDLVRDEIIKYIGGIDSEGNLREGLGLNEDVVHTRVIDAIHNVTGVYDVKTLYLGRDDWGAQKSNIDIGMREVAETSIDRISVEGLIQTADSSIEIMSDTDTTEG